MRSPVAKRACAPPHAPDFTSSKRSVNSAVDSAHVDACASRPVDCKLRADSKEKEYRTGLRWCGQLNDQEATREAILTQMIGDARADDALSDQHDIRSLRYGFQAPLSCAL